MSFSSESRGRPDTGLSRSTVGPLVAALLAMAGSAQASYLVTDIGSVLGSPYNYPRDLNNSNQIVGTFGIGVCSSIRA